MRAASWVLLLSMSGCAATGPRPSALPLELTSLEERRLRGGEPLPLVTRSSPEAKLLRQRAREVPEQLSLTVLASSMERAMHAAGGVGIAGPQVGVGLRVAVLLLGYRGPSPRPVFVRNPQILERSEETVPSYEGCLSVPGVGGLVRRSSWIRVRYLDGAGQPVETRAEGADAILWQHELDHLDGVLYVDRLIGELLSPEEMRRRRKELSHPPPPSPEAP